jgi:hypothetical protein
LQGWFSPENTGFPVRMVVLTVALQPLSKGTDSDLFAFAGQNDDSALQPDSDCSERHWLKTLRLTHSIAESS